MFGRNFIFNACQNAKLTLYRNIMRMGVFHDLLLRIKLILRLMVDRRVNLLVKLLPIGSLVYLLVPDFLPGPFDDAAMIALLSYLFVELFPE